jgi:hypothetical protein
MPGVSCGYRSNYLTSAGLILLTTRAARSKACAAGLSLPNTGTVGGSPAWGVGVYGISVFVSCCVRTGLATKRSLVSVLPNICKQESQTRKTEDTELRRPLASCRCNYGLRKIKTFCRGRRDRVRAPKKKGSPQQGRTC